MDSDKPHKAHRVSKKKLEKKKGDKHAKAYNEKVSTTCVYEPVIANL